MSGSRNQQLARKEGQFIASRMREAYESLASDPNFLLMLGELVQRCGLKDAHDTNNGSEAFKIMGRRQIAVETLAQIEQYVPDIEERVIRERRNFHTDIKKLKLSPDEERQTEEND